MYMRAKDFRYKSSKALNRVWGVAILTTFIAGLLGVFGNAGSSTLSLTGKISDMDLFMLADFLETPMGRIILAFISAFAAVVSLWSIARFLLGGALNLGYRHFTLNIADGNEAKVGDLFGSFDKWGQAFLMQLLMDIYTFLWSLLFIIPGIIKAFAYSMTPYILEEHPELTANEAIDTSIHLMKGNKWRLFCLRLSFIGWDLLCALFTLGIGFLWLNPYKQVAEAAFYREICREKEFR